jgi:hypothetical protein
MTDHLAGLPVEQVAAYYGRLADLLMRERITDTDGSPRTPLSALLLRHYVDNRDAASTFEFDPPGYLRGAPQVLAALRYHRGVFLSTQNAPGGRRGGCAPRLRGDRGFNRWLAPGMEAMHVESLVEIAGNLAQMAALRLRGTRQEQDLFASLRGFQLRSEVTARIATYTGERTVRIEFVSWTAQAIDRYDFDYAEHLTLPNPDFGSTQPGAVRPGDRELTIHHTNARRLEQANLAAPYRVVSRRWQVDDPGIRGDGSVTF